MKIHLDWNADWCRATHVETLILNVTTEQGQSFTYGGRNGTGRHLDGDDLTDPMVVLPMVLKDLGFEITE